MQIEVCIENLEEAELAAKYACNRIEVCSALDLGGLTPSYGMIAACAKIPSIESHILIRPRSGNFIYSSNEIILMKEDIRIAAEAGAEGVVFGCLTKDNEIDLGLCELMVRQAQIYHLEMTFHRAFDFCIKPQVAIESLIQLGFNRLLTSGLKKNAVEGVETIKALIKANNGKIEIMAGSGISDKNIALFRDIGLDAIHFSIRQKNISSSDYLMGSHAQPDEDKLKLILQKIRHNENN